MVLHKGNRFEKGADRYEGQCKEILDCRIAWHEPGGEQLACLGCTGLVAAGKRFEAGDRSQASSCSLNKHGDESALPQKQHLPCSVGNLASFCEQGERTLGHWPRSRKQAC